MNRFILTSVTITAMLAGTAMAQQGGGRGGPAAAVGERAREIERRAELMMERAAQQAAVPRGRIGVTLSSVHEALAAHIGIDADEAILIESVMSGGAAEEAGVKAFDIIIKVNGKSPVTQRTLREAVMATEPGKKVRLVVLRAGEQHEIDVPVQPFELRPFERPEGRGIGGGGGWRLQLEAADAEELARRLNEIFEGREIDADALRKLRERALGRTGRPDISIFQDDDGTWLRPRGGFGGAIGGGRHIELWRDGDSGIRMMVPPMYGQAPLPPVAMMQEEMERRTESLERIEQRLERIEKMLELLLEERGG